MPVFRATDEPPAWCELRRFEIVELAPGRTHRFERVGRKEKLIVGEGRCRIHVNGEDHDGQPRTNLDLADDGRFQITQVTEAATVVRMCGDWGDDLGGSGLFAVEHLENPPLTGDAVPYKKTTRFDSHWHDCDEYWIVYGGRARVVSEGKHFEVGPGDCVATGIGHHHDVVSVTQPLRAVYFETTMQRQKRRGHLWEHEHGPAEPDPARV